LIWEGLAVVVQIEIDAIRLWLLPLNRKLNLYEQIDDEDIEVDGY